MSNISMVAPSIIFFISFELKPDVTFSDFTTKKRIFTTFGSQIAEILRCYCNNLGQFGKDIVDCSLCDSVNLTAVEVAMATIIPLI